MARGISTPNRRYSMVTMVALEPTGRFVNLMGEVVMTSPMRWWSMISTTSASSMPGNGLARLVVVHEDDAPSRPHRHVRARDDADGEPVCIEHHGLAQLAGHEVLDGLLEQAVLVQHEHVRLGDVLHFLVERGDEVVRHRHLVGAALLELVGRRDVALRDHTRGDEAPVRAVVVRDHEGADVALAQQPTGLQDGGVTADGEGARRHDVEHARVNVADDLGRGQTVALKHPRRLGRQRPQSGGHVRARRAAGGLVAACELVFEMRVRDRRADGVVVGVLVPHHDDRCRCRHAMLLQR